MGRALALRGDFGAADLKRLARSSRDADQTRRLLSLAVIYDGGSRAKAAETGGVGRQIVRDWVERFNAEGPDELVSRKPPGQWDFQGFRVRAGMMGWKENPHAQTESPEDT